MGFLKRLLGRIANTRYLYVEFLNKDDGISVKIKPHCTQRDIALFINTLCKDNPEIRAIIRGIANRTQDDIDKDIFN
jgi:hypothetical protein